ncbi:MAG: hemin uptake protein HemP [Thiotrichaceae bacterium]|nr:hemin uptake protein HemP [Thiotrichaceae bacterium]
MKDLNREKVSSPHAAHQATRSSQSGDAPTVRRLTSDELLAGQRQLVIEHHGEEYRLRITSKEKLILTK